MKVSLQVNGQAQEVEVEPRSTLADTLRDDLGLTGTNLGCEHGVCGSCTVQVDGEAVRSCLVLTAQCDGRAVTTVEGLASADGTLTPLQEAFSTEHGLQCGFCTPGFLMLLDAALRDDPNLPDDTERLDEVLASNLCRCTGYVGIRKAAIRAARPT